MSCVQQAIGHDRRDRPICQCFVSHPHAPQKHRYYWGLIDTGAAHCFITRRVAQELGIHSHKQWQVTGVHGIQRKPAYRANIGLFAVRPPNGGYSPYDTKLHFPSSQNSSEQMDAKILHNAEVGELENDEQFDVIIGMEYLSSCTLTIANGNFALFFEPDSERIAC